MAAKKFRPLSEDEAALIKRLLTAEFAGKTEIERQIASASVREIDEDGSLEFRVRSTTKAPVERRVPVEGEAEDSDGGGVHVLLHVIDGLVDELEFYKEDGSRVLKKPRPEAMRLLVLG